MLRIGNVELKNNVILAPMAGLTDLPFRRICEIYKPGLVVTEMVSSKAIFFGDEKTKKLLKTEGEKRPISMQIFGSDPETMGLLPITGVPLLFVSYGGSSMMTSFIALGILLNISSQRKSGLFNK